MGDGIIVSSPDVQYEVIWRHGGADSPVATFEHAFGAGSMEQYEETKSAPAIAAAAGDRLVLRISLLSTDPNGEWIPYGEQPPSPTMRWTSVDVP